MSEIVEQFVGSRQWSFVLDQVRIDPNLLPFELAPGCMLTKASSEQVSNISRNLKNLLGFTFGAPDSRYRCDLHEVKVDGQVISHEERELPIEEWRYYGIATEDGGSLINELQYAVGASLRPLRVGALSLLGSGGCIWQGAILHEHFHSLPIVAEDVAIITREVLEDFRATFALWRERFPLGESQCAFPEIKRAAQMLDNLAVLPRRSDFHVLGLFAIIEMMITHNPKLDDRGDSITHQMQTKLPLLFRRFDHPIESSELFGGATEKKIWGALYKYRSALAHGGAPDFQGDLQVLGSPEKARGFLKSVVSALIRHSLREPQLYRDLKVC